MNVWVVIAATLSVATAAPCIRCQSGGGHGQHTGAVVVVGTPVKIQQPHTIQVKRGLGTKTKADVTGKILSIGNAVAVVSGGARAREQLPNQKGDATARVTLNTQKTGIGAGSAAAVGRSDVDGTGQAASSQGDARTETRSSGQASTEADANGRGATLAKGSRTDADGGSSSATTGKGTASGVSQTLGTASQLAGRGTDAGSGSASQAKSSGSGGSKVAGRGRGAATGGGTTSISGSQTKGDVIGDAVVETVERGAALSELGGDGTIQVGRTQATSKGDVKTKGDGASGSGQTTAKGTAGRNGTTASDSVARNQLKASKDGVAKADLFSLSVSALGLDGFTKDLVVDTKSKTTGYQMTAGSASSATNAASAAGSTLIGAGAVADTTFKGKTSNAGTIKGTLEATGQGRVTKGKPVVQAREPDEHAAAVVVVKQPAPVDQTPSPYVPPYVPPKPTRPPYTPPVQQYKPPYHRPGHSYNKAPYVPPKPTRPPYTPPVQQYKPPYHRPGHSYNKAPYVPPKPTPPPYVPPYHRPKPSYNKKSYVPYVPPKTTRKPPPSSWGF